MTNIVSLPDRRAKDRDLQIAVGKTVKGNKVKNQIWKWDQLVEKLKTPLRTSETFGEFMRMSKDEQTEVKDRAGFYVPAHFEPEVRKGENMGPKCLGTLDLDHATPESLGLIKERFQGIEYVLHSTHKHETEHPRFRLVFLLTRRVGHELYEPLMRALAHRAGIIELADHTTYEFSRVMFFPSCASDADFVFHHEEGAAVDPTPVVNACYLDWHDITEWPMSSKDLNPPRVHGPRLGDPRDKSGVIGAFCQSFSIAEAIEKYLPGVYLPGVTPNRYTYFNGTTANGAVLYQDGQYLHSWHDSDPCSRLTVNAFDMVRIHLFVQHDARQDKDTPSTKLNSFKEMLELAQEDKAVQGLLLDQRTTLIEDFDEAEAPEEIPTGAVEPGTPAAPPKAQPASLSLSEKVTQWKLQLHPNTLSLARDRLWNIEAILENDPRLKGCVAVNIFTGNLVQKRALPRYRGTVGGDWTDTAETALAAYFNRGYDVGFNAALISQAVGAVAVRNQFDPVRDWMDTLVWDGTPRLSRFLPDFLGTPADAYHAAIFTKWLTAGVARTYHPGHKFDFILVLEGIEGIGKSTLFEVLANGWFCGDFRLGATSKEVIEQSQGALIVEVAELVTRRDTEVEHTKALLSRGVERARMSYARYAIDRPRRWIAAGTTNETRYLKSETGNRRYWVARTDGRHIDIEALRACVDQLWAEAKVLWECGEALYLDDALVAATAVEHQAQRVEGDEWTASVTAWLEETIPANYYSLPRGTPDVLVQDFDGPIPTRVVRDRVCATEVWVECLKGEEDKFDQKNARRINVILTKLGWCRVSTIRFGAGIRYGRGPGFFRPPV